MHGRLLELVGLVRVLGQAHEQHGERRVGDDRRAGLIALRKQETRHRERDCGQTGDRRDGDEQVQANALIEQRLGGRLSAVAPRAEHRRINAAHDADRDHGEQAARDRVVGRIVGVQHVAVKADHEIFVDLVEQRDRDRNTHQRNAVLEEAAEQRSGEKAQADNGRKAEREYCADGRYAVRDRVREDRRERRRVIRLAADERERDRELERGRGQRPENRRLNAAELNERGVQHLKRGIRAEHQCAAPVKRIARYSCRDAAACRDEHAQTEINGRNGRKQAAPAVRAIFLADIARRGIRHPAGKDEVDQLHGRVGQVEAGDSTLDEDMRIERRAGYDEQTLDDLRRQEHHRIPCHGIFGGQVHPSLSVR